MIWRLNLDSHLYSLNGSLFYWYVINSVNWSLHYEFIYRNKRIQYFELTLLLHYNIRITKIFTQWSKSQRSIGSYHIYWWVSILKTRLWRRIHEVKDSIYYLMKLTSWFGILTHFKILLILENFDILCKTIYTI